MSTTTSKPLKPKRGTTAQNNNYTGEAYEVTLDTDKKTLVVHDGLTAGGFPLARADEVAAKDAAQDAAIAEAQSSADEKALSFEVDGLDLVITYGNGTTERVKLPTGKGVGDLWWGHDPKSVPANVQLYAGQLLSRAAYEAHSGLVFGGKRTVVTEEEWQAMVAEQGFCPWYSEGDGSTTYRMPLIKGVHPKFVAALAEAGGYTAAGLPNITGTIPKTRAYNATGAFYKASGSGYNHDSGSGGDSIGFDASRSNPIYGASATVQPPAVSVILGEYVVGAVATLGEADAESLLASVTLLESEVRALESGVGRASAYIVETWKSGTSWYRKWSDGWIEQGGLLTTSGNYGVITLHTEMRSIDYGCLATNNDASVNDRAYRLHPLTTTTFEWKRRNMDSGNSENGIFYWRVEG